MVSPQYGFAPEITQAYQNDPRTQIAQAMIKAGTSTAPVATGGWGVTDGVARALQAVAGSFVQKKQMQKYQDQQEATRAAIADALSPPDPTMNTPVDYSQGYPGGQGGPGGYFPGGLNGGPTVQGTPPIAPPMGGSAPDPMSGGQGGGQMPSGMAGAGGAASPSTPPNAPPQPMVPPAGQNPAGAPPQPPMAPQSGTSPPQPPQGPAPVAMPAAPQEQGVQSQRLAIARSLLGIKGSPMAMQMGLDYADKGLTDQQADNVRVAQNKHDTGLTGYQSQLNDYTNAASQARTATYGAEAATTSFNRDLQKAEKEHGYKLSENAQQDAAANYRAGLSASAAVQVAHINGSNELATQGLRNKGDVDVANINNSGKSQARASGFFATAAGSKFMQDTGKEINKNDGLIADLKAFQIANKAQSTGGINSATPGVDYLRSRFGDNYTNMKAITQHIVPQLRVPGDILSDGDKVRYEQSTASVSNTKGANDLIINRLVNAAQRNNEFQRSKMEAVASGEAGSFFRDWEAYKNAVPIDHNIPFPQWKASLRQVK